MPKATKKPLKPNEILALLEGSPAVPTQARSRSGRVIKRKKFHDENNKTKKTLSWDQRNEDSESDSELFAPNPFIISGDLEQAIEKDLADIDLNENDTNAKSQEPGQKSSKTQQKSKNSSVSQENGTDFTGSPNPTKSLKKLKGLCFCSCVTKGYLTPPCIACTHNLFEACEIAPELFNNQDFGMPSRQYKKDRVFL